MAWVPPGFPWVKVGVGVAGVTPADGVDESKKQAFPHWGFTGIGHASDGECSGYAARIHRAASADAGGLTGYGRTGPGRGRVAFGRLGPAFVIYHSGWN